MLTKCKCIQRNARVSFKFNLHERKRVKGVDQNYIENYIRRLMNSVGPSTSVLGGTPVFARCRGTDKNKSPFIRFPLVVLYAPATRGRPWWSARWPVQRAVFHRSIRVASLFTADRRDPPAGRRRPRARRLVRSFVCSLARAPLPRRGVKTLSVFRDSLIRIMPYLPGDAAHR